MKPHSVDVGEKWVALDTVSKKYDRDQRGVATVDDVSNRAFHRTKIV